MSEVPAVARLRGKQEAVKTYNKFFGFLREEIRPKQRPGEGVPVRGVHVSDPWRLLETLYPGESEAFQEGFWEGYKLMEERAGVSLGFPGKERFTETAQMPSLPFGRWTPPELEYERKRRMSMKQGAHMEEQLWGKKSRERGF